VKNSSSVSQNKSLKWAVCVLTRLNLSHLEGHITGIFQSRSTRIVEKYFAIVEIAFQL
jgi:hypothetical protein